MALGQVTPLFYPSLGDDMMVNGDVRLGSQVTLRKYLPILNKPLLDFGGLVCFDQDSVLKFNLNAFLKVSDGN